MYSRLMSRNAMLILIYKRYPIEANGVRNKIFTQFHFMYLPDFLITDLKPYSNYSISIEVCTRVGCMKSKEVHFQTKDELPEGNEFFDRNFYDKIIS